MTSGLWFDFIVGSSIILIPLAILIITIARDLDSKYKGLSRRIAKLNRAYGLIMDDQDDSPINSNATELDEHDNKLIRDSAKEIGAENCIKGEKIESTINCGHALALKKVMSIRMAEQVLLANKIKFFRLYSVTAYIFIIISMSILPVLVYAGFNWRWK
jgi:hypothetical protein